GNITYTISGTPASDGTILNSGSGADRIQILSSNSPLTINSSAGSGADSISVGSLGNTLSGITAGVTVNAAATDSLVLNDTSFTGSRTFTVSDTSIGWGGSSVAYAGLGSITIYGGKGGNTFDVLAGSETAALTILGGSG